MDVHLKTRRHNDKRYCARVNGELVTVESAARVFGRGMGELSSLAEATLREKQKVTTCTNAQKSVERRTAPARGPWIARRSAEDTTLCVVA